MNTLGAVLAITTLVIWTMALGYSLYIWFVRRSKRKHPKPCQHKTTIKLSSIQKQKCADCYDLLDWPLKPNQQPLVSSNRDRRTK